MGQMGFFDLGNRYTGLDAKNEPLLKIDGVVPWEDLRARLEAVWRRADKVRTSRAGRKPWDAIVMFKTQGSVKRAVSLGGNLDIKVDAIFRKMQVVYPLIFLAFSVNMPST